MCSCVGVLSSTNSPLFVHSSDPERALADQYSLHTSIDVIEEKTNTNQANQAGQNTPLGKRTGDFAQPVSRELYLGTLFATENQKVFGYVTNTRVKFIVIVDSSNTSLRDNEVRQMFRKLHTAYTQLMSNPFYVPDTPIKSKRFMSVVKNLTSSQTQH